MRVVLACHRYHPVPGGSERIAQLLAEAAARRGDDVTVVTQAEPGVPSAEELNGVDVVRLPMRHVAGVRIPVRYHETLRATRADLFHLHGNRIWCADFYLPFARRYDWPSVGTGHGFYQYEMHRRPWDRLYFERYFPRLLRGLSVYACDTEHERQQLLSWGVPESKLVRIPLGADAGEFAQGGLDPAAYRARLGVAAPHLAVYLGGFFENKRVDRLVEGVAPTQGAWALLALGKDVPGSRYDLAYCRARASALGVELVAPGIVPREEAVAALRAADAVVSGSEYEGFGVALAEGLAAGRPFVAWPAGAAPEMAAHGAGEIVRSSEELATALRRLERPEVAAERARRAALEAHDWTEAAMVRRYLELYDRLVGERAARSR